jgi:hypothetical protein
VGGDEAAVLVGLSESESSSDLVEELLEAGDVSLCAGRMSGALYESMLVVWMSSSGPEILLRMEGLPKALAVVLLL